MVDLQHFIVSFSKHSVYVGNYLSNVCNKEHKRIKNPVEHLRWSFFAKIVLKAFNCELFLHKLHRRFSTEF